MLYFFSSPKTKLHDEMYGFFQAQCYPVKTIALKSQDAVIHRMTKGGVGN